MARKLRVWYPNAIYHITTRGNNKNDIFRNDKDYNYYLGCIEDALDYYKNKYIVISYCLMSNHTHLQVETTDLPIGHFIKRISSNYAQNFNDKYGNVGHLFQGRYGSELIENDEYFLEVSRYIHLNPVRAYINNMPEEYKWSSYGMYIGLKKEEIIKSDRILAYFQQENSREMYKNYIEEALL